LLEEQYGINRGQLLVPESMDTVVKSQKQKLESKQWTYTWFGKPQKVRDNVDTVLRVVQEASGFISAGMTMAPVYVSLPWTMISVLIPFIMSDSKAMISAIDGLQQATSIMTSYGYLEVEYLRDAATRLSFEEVVCELYTAVLKYQAAVAIYFGQTTLKRLGRNVSGKQSWPDAMTELNSIEQRCRPAIQGLQASMIRRGFQGLTELLQQGTLLMKNTSQAVVNERVNRQRIIDWISPINPFQDHADKRRPLGERYVASGQWLLQDQAKYLPWKSGQGGVLLLRGGMGTGKSSLMSIAIEDLIASADTRVAFAYCSDLASPGNRAGTLRNDPLNVLRCLLSQCSVLPDGTIVRAVQDLFDGSGRQQNGDCNFDIAMCIATMQDVIVEHPSQSITCVVDALDECVDVGELLDSLCSVQQSCPGLRLLLAARPGVSVTPTFGADACEVLAVDSRNADDIQHYIDLEVSKRHEESGFTVHQANRLKAALSRLADGMFRWVVLEIELFLRKSRTQGSRQMPSDIERRLSNLESSTITSHEKLMKAYEEIFELAVGSRDEHARKELVCSALSWVLVAFQPLSISQLLAASSIQPEGSIEEEATVQMLLEYCSNLLVVTGKGVARFAHLSVRQFLEDRQRHLLGRDESHDRLATACLKRSLCIVGGEHETSLLNSVVSPTSMSGVDEYSLENWPLHYRLGRRSQVNLVEQMRSNARSSFDRLLIWFADASDILHQDTLGNNILLSAIQEGHTRKVKWILYAAVCLQEPHLVETANQAGNNALHTAAQIRLNETFTWLVNSGVSLTSTNFFGLTPIQLMVIHDCHFSVSHPSIRSNALTQRDSAGNTIMHYMYFHGRAQQAMFLRQSGFDLSLQNGDGFTALDLLTLNTHRALHMAEEPDQSSRHLSASRSPTRQSLLEALDIQPLQPDCSLCAMADWIHHADESTEFVVTPSFDTLLDNKGCSLCTRAGEQLKEALADQHVESEVRVKIVLSANSRREGRDRLVYVLPGLAECEFELSLGDLYNEKVNDPDMFSKHQDHDHVSSLFQGRIVQPSRVTEAIHEWRTACDNHDQCAQPKDRSWPRRMVDLGPPGTGLAPRISEECPNETERRFVFLSYTWGAPFNVLTLQSHNAAQFARGIDLELLPSLHLSAMRLAQDLGYRYIWIDALCMIQGDHDDFEREGPAISDYASQADIVFATSQNGVREPLFATAMDVRNCLASFVVRSKAPECTVSHTRHLEVTNAMTPASTIFHRDVLQRAWRLQETLLARRMVFFGPEQVYWSCARSVRSQDRSTTLAPVVLPLPTFVGSLNTLPMTDGLRAVYNYWYYVVQLNMQGHLSFSSDRLYSVSAIAGPLGATTDSVYLTGLWIDDIAYGLLWTSDMTSNSAADNRVLSGTYPSWTWASNEASISYWLIAGIVVDMPGGLRDTEVFTLKQAQGDSARVGPTQVAVCTTLFIHGRTCAVSTLDRTLLGTFDYFFDRRSEQANDQLTGVILLLVAPWALSPGLHHPTRWAGLMIKPCETDKGENAYARTGVFLGPDCRTNIDSWTWSDITLC
jgi:hypothetical protein